MIIEQDSIDLRLSVAEIYGRVTNEDMQTYLQSLEAGGGIVLSVYLSPQLLVLDYWQS